MARKPIALTPVLTDKARRSLTEIWDWNAETYSPVHADKYLAFLTQETSRCAEIGTPRRQVPEDDSLYYHVIKRQSGGHGHVVIYEINGNQMVVLVYFHTAQDWLTRVKNLQR